MASKVIELLIEKTEVLNTPVLKTLLTRCILRIYNTRSNAKGHNTSKKCYYRNKQLPKPSNIELVQYYFLFPCTLPPANDAPAAIYHPSLNKSVCVPFTSSPILSTPMGLHMNTYNPDCHLRSLALVPYFSVIPIVLQPLAFQTLNNLTANPH